MKNSRHTHKDGFHPGRADAETDDRASASVKHPIDRRLLWSILTIIIAVLTIRLVVGFSGGMSAEDLQTALRSANPFWLAAALIFMTGFIFFEGEAVLCISRSTSFYLPSRHGFLYAAADTYFSAVTPSATGGQPASAFFMIRDGMPASTVTAVLVFNLIMYTLAAMCNGLVCVLIRPSFFLHFSTGSKLLIGVGLIVLIGMSIMFWMILKKRSIIPVISDRVIGFLHRIHIVRHPEKRKERMRRMIEEYGVAVDMMTGQRSTIILTFLLNLLQRFCQIAVTVSMYMALGGKGANALSVYITQSMVVLGSNSVPIPGSMGVTDYLMLDGFMNLMSRDEAFRLEFLARGVYFYLCVLVSGFVVLAYYLHMRLKARRTYRS